MGNTECCRRRICDGAQVNVRAADRGGQRSFLLWCFVSSVSYYQIVGSFHFLLSRLSFFRSRLFSYPLPSSPRYEEALKFFLTAEKSEPGFYKNNQVSEKTRQKKKRIKRKKKKKKKKKPPSYIQCGARISEYIQCAYIPSI